MNRVFVYGTLKEGFANFGVNAGRRVPGVFRTVERYPLFIIGEINVPWLVNRPGEGEYVAGQVFEVDDRVLEGMDRLERVDQPGWYTRAGIPVREDGTIASAPMPVFVYFGSADRLSTEKVHAGPLAEFTLEHNLRYRHAS